MNPENDHPRLSSAKNGFVCCNVWVHTHNTSCCIVYVQHGGVLAGLFPLTLHGDHRSEYSENLSLFTPIFHFI